MPDYVFLSYDRADRAYVDSLVRRFAAEGIPYWIDHGIGDEGEPPAVRADQLAGAAAVVVVVTPRAVASPRVDGDVRQARELGKPILPLVRRRSGSALLADLRPEDVTRGGMPSSAFYDRVREHTGTTAPATGPPESWRPRTRLPHRLGPIPATAAEVWGLRALLVAALILAVAGTFSGAWNTFLLFPAFGIPDLLFGWFRWRRFRQPARWSTDVRATILLTGLTVYLSVAAPARLTAGSSPLLLIGVPVAALLGWAAVAVWLVQVVRDRPR